MSAKKSLSIEEIVAYVCGLSDGIVFNKNWGERALFYNPDRRLPKGIYLLTFKERDGDNDKASNIDRGNIFRLNLGLTRKSFEREFGATPERPAKGGVVNVSFDFQELDVIMPHPVYGWMNWIAVLNPGIETFEKLKPHIVESLNEAKIKFRKKVQKA